MMAADDWHIYTGGVVPPDVTRVRIHESVSVIPAQAFHSRPNIEVVKCHDGVKTVEEKAFFGCYFLRRVIMRGVTEVEHGAFWYCEALTDVECGKLEIIKQSAFAWCESLRSIDLPSAKIVEMGAFSSCEALTSVKFGNELTSIEGLAFYRCTSLEQITIPLKDGMITSDNIFERCENLNRVDLVGGVHETVAALELEEWKIDMKDEIDSINLFLPTTPAGGDGYGGKGLAVLVWIRSVLNKIVHYKAEHHRYLKEATITLEHALWKKRLSEINVPERDDKEERAKCRVKCGADIVIKNVLPFLELPPFTFEGEDEEGE